MKNHLVRWKTILVFREHKVFEIFQITIWVYQLFFLLLRMKSLLCLKTYAIAKVEQSRILDLINMEDLGQWLTMVIFTYDSNSPIQCPSLFPRALIPHTCHRQQVVDFKQDRSDIEFWSRCKMYAGTSFNKWNTFLFLQISSLGL